MREREMHCATCHGEMVFEVPPCQDGHVECPELVCERCGAAEVLVPMTLLYWARPRGLRVAPQQRRAA